MSAAIWFDYITKFTNINWNISSDRFLWIFTTRWVYPNSLCIIRCLHSESALIAEIAVTPISSLTSLLNEAFLSDCC